MSSVAAPLLAGFSITCVTLAVQWYERFRCLWLRLLSVASVVLLMAVQYGFWARRAQRSYSLGVVIFLAGLGLVVGEGMALVPPATPVRGWQPGPLAGYSAHGCRWAGWVWPGVAQQVGQRRRGESSASSNACRDRAWSSVTSWWSRRALSNQSW